MSNLFANTFSPLENDIDGEGLILLINDMQEFKDVIPRAVSRLKIKQLVNSKQVCVDLTAMPLDSEVSKGKKVVVCK